MKSTCAAAGGFWFTLLVLVSASFCVSAQTNIGAVLISVTQNDTNNTADSVTVTSTISIGGLHVRGGSNRGDYNVQMGDDQADDVTTGVLMTCVAENGRNNGEAAFPGINFCTTAMDYSRDGGEQGGYFIPVFNSPAGAEYNINVAAAFFPYSQWLGGFARNSGETNGGADDLFTGSSGIVHGVQFVELGGGKFKLDLTSLGIHSTTDGVLLVTGGKNEDNYAMSFANPTNNTWTLFVKDNGTDAGSYEQDPIAFVFIPKTNTAVVSGKFAGNGSPLIYSGTSPRFTVVNTATGIWRLTIPGQSPATGVLVISAEGGVSQNVDNIVSYQPDGDGWLIQSRDLPGNPPSLQTPGGGTEPVASFVFIPSVSATLVGPADNASGIGVSPELQVNVPPGLNENLKVAFYGRAISAPSNTNADFTIVALPDTQYYSGALHGGVPAMFQSQADWIVANRTNLNIAFVTHLGDITEHGQNSGLNYEWRVATNAMYRLENPFTTLLASGIPYGMGVGNHDQTPIGGGDSADSSFFNQFFGVEHFIGYDYYGGHYGTNNNNSFQFFSAGGMDFIAIHLEYDTAPDPAVLAWADNLVKMHPNHRAIVTSHWIVNTGFDATFSDQGRAIYNALRTNANFFLMLCGHISGEGQRTDAFGGHTVYSVLTDYQSRENGGNGWLRYYKFSPRDNVIRAFTYSPWLNQYETDEDSQFSLSYSMNLPETTDAEFELLATNVVATNGVASIVWPDLASGASYQWFVVVSDDSGNTETSPTWKFSVSNSPPVTPNQSLTIPGDSPTNIVLHGTDANGDALVFKTNTLPQHGLLQAFQPAEGIVTYIPVRGFRGIDRFIFSASDGMTNSSAASMNLIVVAPADGNGNQLPDAWEATYGVNDPAGDDDGDGQSNLEEYRAGTNPTNSASVLKIMGTTNDATGHSTITWASVGGVRYRVQYSDGDTNSGPAGPFTDIVRPLEQELDSAPDGTPSVQSFTDTSTKTTGQRYYRVRVVTD